MWVRQMRFVDLRVEMNSSRGFLSDLGTLIAAVVVTAVVVFGICFMVWYHFGGGAWRSGVSVIDATLVSPQELELNVSSCFGAPQVFLWETDDEVKVNAVAFSTPLRGSLLCGDVVTVYLQESLGDRIVVDKHNGQVVTVWAADAR